MMHNALTDVPGIRVGHWTDREAATGCTVVLCPDGAVAGVDVRGTAPGTRETDLLDPVCLVETVHAVVIGGGSAYGLAAADGVMRWLEERGKGFDMRVARVPIVPAAILFDLAIGAADVRPDAAAGYAACEAASDGPIEQGCAGAGTGATAGKALGIRHATKSGLGTASRRVAADVVVAALAAVNPYGEIIDRQTQTIIAGVRRGQGGFAATLDLLANSAGHPLAGVVGANTTLVVIATNAALSKAEATKVAQMAQDGLARVIRPAHTHFDGDTIFALSTGRALIDLTTLGALAADVVADAILNGVAAATSLHGLPAASDLGWPRT